MQMMSPVHLPAPNIELEQSAVPLSLTIAVSGDFRIYEMEVVNNSSGQITLTCWDAQNIPLILIPAVPIAAGAVLTYTRRFGRTVRGGMKWQASGVGLFGNIQGQRI